MKLPIPAESGKTKKVVHILVAKTPAVADNLFNLKIVAKNKVENIPSPGNIPKKTPSAVPAAILLGVSSMRKNCFKKFFIFSLMNYASIDKIKFIIYL